MDPEQIKKRQTLRVLFSEAMMVLSVIVIMTVLIMITSGYWINQNFEVERQGMLQVYSSPLKLMVAKLYPAVSTK